MPECQVGEINHIMDLVALGETYENIASKFNQNVLNIKTIVLNTICDRIESKHGLEEYFCNEYNVTKQELDEFRSRMIISF